MHGIPHDTLPQAPKPVTSDSFIRRVETLFLAVQGLDASDVERFLAEAATRDPEAIAEVRAMLAPTDRELDGAVPKVCINDTAVEAEEAGQRIDRYLLQERIGEGGFGTVWRAEQQEPVRRDVALKIIKRGMDTRQVVARFEAERQTLARMEHPGIATVLDGGATATGRPYFVMELVRGDPLLAACDRLRLDLRARLRLFLQVCDAVDHAHQKGVIHRDLKPSNVLVEMRDGQPAPKVIDFGIAKALDNPAVAVTVLTQFQQLVGTPGYMAPEQGEPDGQDVDTRTDVYALGVMLYELLTGTNPFAGIEQRGLLDMLQAIRQLEPPKPSRQPTADARRLRGELDWIVMKAIEKDRARRYGSVRELAADLRRHRNDEPVLAGPPSATYRLQKFVRRYRLQVSAATAVVISLVVGLVASILFALDAADQSTRAMRQEEAATKSATRALRAERDAQDLAKREAGLRLAAERAGQRTAATTAFLLDTIGLADPDVTQLPDMTMRNALAVAAASVGENFAAYPDSEAALRIVIGRAYLALGMPEEARPHLERAHALHTRVLPQDRRTVFRISRMLTRVKFLIGDFAWVGGGRATRQLGIEIVAGLQPEIGQELAELQTAVLRPLFDIDEVEDVFDRAVDAAQSRLAPDDGLWFEISWVLWSCSYELGWRSDELVIADLMDKAVALHRPLTGGRITPAIRQMSRAALEHRVHANDDAGAEKSVRATIAQLEQRLGKGHPSLAFYDSILGECLTRRGEFAAAEQLLRNTIAAITVRPGTMSMGALAARSRLATLLEATGRSAEALEVRDDIAALLVQLDGVSRWRGVEAAFPPGEGSVRDLGFQVDAGLRAAAQGDMFQLVRALPRLIERGQELPIGSARRTLHASHLTAVGGLLAGAQVWQLAEPAYREAFEITRADAYDQPDLEFEAAFGFGLTLTTLRGSTDAEDPLREAMRLAPRVTRADPLDAGLRVRTVLGIHLMQAGKLGEAESLLEGAYFERVASDPGDPLTALARVEWLRLLTRTDRTHYAEQVVRQRLTVARQECNGESLQSLSLLCELGGLCGPSRMPEVADLVAPGLRSALAELELPAGACNQFAWYTVRVANRGPDDYAAALALAERALISEPDNRAFLNTRGVALYRVHRDAEAVEALRTSERIAARASQPQPADQAFLALACLRLHRTAEAGAAYANLEELMRVDKHDQSLENRAFLAEVETHWQR